VLQAIAARRAVEGGLPLNVKLLFDGEEEMGSPSLGAFVREQAGLLKADAAVIIDIVKYRADLPAIYYGAKGLLSVTIDVSGPATDLHSGIYAGDVANPADALVRILAGMKSEEGKILIPGFYDRVKDISQEERAAFAALPFDEPDLISLLGVAPAAQEKGYTSPECAMARPTLSVNGLWGGALPGAPLMIIPDKAGALVSFRLVPDQRPEEIFRLLKGYFDARKVPGIKVKLKVNVCQEPFVTSRDSCAVRAAGRALADAFGRRPVLVRSGGTSGIVPLLMKYTGIRDIVITGWGDPGAGEHSPNEHFSLDNYRRGIIATAGLLYELAKMKKPAESRPIFQ